MPRLPEPGKDAGNWGDILNDYLGTSIAIDGTLKHDIVGAAQLKANSVTNTVIATGTIAEDKLAADVQVKLNANGNPPVTSVASKTGVVTLVKADVGLNNVDNTSDANKPISTATQTALDSKQASGSYVTTTNLTNGLANKVDNSSVGAANGLATLDADSKILESQLPDRLGESELNDAFVNALALARSSLAGRLAPAGVVDLYAVTTDAPTITNTTAATINGRVENANSKNVTILGRTGAWVSGATSVDGDYTGREFYVDSNVEFSWKARGTDTARFIILVDGLPTDTTPITPPGSTTAGVTYYMRLVWGSSKRRKITILAARISAWGAFRFAVTANLQPSPPRPLITIVGDSFNAGWTTGNNTSSLQGIGVVLARLLGVDVQLAAQPSTGYLVPSTTETFGDAARITKGTERKPELVMFMGSGNDLGVSTLQAFTMAVQATYDAWATALPSVPFVVFGISPRDSTGTITSDIAARNNAIREVAIEHSSVIAFHDTIGIPTGAVPIAHSSIKSDYQPGDYVTYQGSVWQLSPHIVGATPAGTIPGTSERWRLATWVMTGTGRVGATTGDGTRDVLLSSDGTHPEPAGLIALAQRVEDAIRADLAS